MVHIVEIESRQKLNIGAVILSLLAGLLTWIAVAMITSSISLLLATLIALFLKNTGISDSLLFGIYSTGLLAVSFQNGS